MACKITKAAMMLGFMQMLGGGGAVKIVSVRVVVQACFRHREQENQQRKN
jgi:hypothetical protein